MNCNEYFDRCVTPIYLRTVNERFPFDLTVASAILLSHIFDYLSDGQADADREALKRKIEADLPEFGALTAVANVTKHSTLRRGPRKGLTARAVKRTYNSLLLSSAGRPLLSTDGKLLLGTVPNIFSLDGVEMNLDEIVSKSYSYFASVIGQP